MTTPSWSGARWWKVDLHTHTPASEDYGKGPEQATLKQRTPQDWLLDFMRAGIDCVAVTDHNTAAWVDRLRTALQDLESQTPEGYRPITLLPGVEISVQGGVHLLAILPTETRSSDLDTLLGAVGFKGKKGRSEDVTSESFEKVVAEVVRAGGIAIPAHVDDKNGLFTTLSGSTLKQAVSCNGVVAMEVLGADLLKPAVYSEKKVRWTEVLGSDSHHPFTDSGLRYPGSQFTWVKMGSPSLEGLNLALRDGLLSVRRSKNQESDPNQEPPLILETVEISKARYMGRSGPFSVGLSPWLNTIIGGRGTGKSSLVEFVRLALRREGEIPEDLEAEFKKYTRPYVNRNDSGLLTDDSVIRVTYRKNRSRFRIQWSSSGNLDAIEEEVRGVWRQAEGDVAHRFPIRIFSQKQVFQLAKSPLALLEVVDEAPEVDRRAWEVRRNEVESRYLSLRAKVREIEASLLEESRLRGELDDVKRKLAIFENAGHADVLKSFQLRRRQQRIVESWEEEWSSVGRKLRRFAADLVPNSLDETTMNTDSKKDADLCTIAATARKELEEVRLSLEQLANRADEILSRWQTARDESSWMEAVEEAAGAYNSLEQRLAVEGAGDPSAYGELVQRRQSIELRLEGLADRKREIRSLEQQASSSLNDILEIRRALTESRRAFLESVLKWNRFVSIKIVPYGAHETAHQDFRRLLHRDSGGFEKDIGEPESGGMLGEVFEDRSPDGIEKKLSEVKLRVRRIASGSHHPATLADQRFATHLGRLPSEAFDRLDLWYPEDSLDVSYRSTSDSRSLRPIEEGSPGQKTAALLAFLLSYGDEPLILDQPEDDLDNHLIYELIVAQLREVKQHRQVIVVTHNANIVVNGDAELVVALDARGGETQKEYGCLQEKRIRDVICEFMEGGRDAFEERYRRIYLEASHV